MDQAIAYADAAQPTYGFMNWFLNTARRDSVNRRPMPSAPETVYWHLGNGTNAIICDPEHDLVVVTRWIEGNALDGLMQRVLASLRDAPRAAGSGRAPGRDGKFVSRESRE